MNIPIYQVYFAFKIYNTLRNTNQMIMGTSNFSSLYYSGIFFIHRQSIKTVH